MSIVLVGRSGAGKSSISRELVTKFNFKLYETGEFVKKMYQESVENVSDNGEGANLGTVIQSRLDFVNSMIQKHGKSFFLREMLKEIQQENVILCGLRSTDEIKFINSIWKDAFIVNVVCDEDTLFSRYIQRELKEVGSVEETKKIFIKRRTLEENMGIKNINLICDYTLNTTSLDVPESAKIVAEAYIKYKEKKKYGNE